ncbi:MAG TPA: DUF808 domain-containing protein [Chromatiales bacterium]|nr:DUF808 domain-containing protein [Chromatiales bacterium]
MAGASLLALFDDIATILDDISTMTKVAAKKTAGVLGDDLALNAEQVSGIRAERELPVVWAVAKGSFLNKLILVPAALTISAFIPWLITPLLMIGGAYLCFEGFEKVAHRFLHGKEEEEAQHAEIIKAFTDPNVDMVAFERDKIKGAIRTDFVLSAEIVVLALGIVKESPFITQVGVVSLIAILITVVVYGLVASFVKIDDVGLYLLRDQMENSWSAFKRVLGRLLLGLAPFLMKTLAVVGTIAMFLVGGGILLHGIPHAHEWLEHAEHFVSRLGGIGDLLAAATPVVLNGLFGLLAGGIVVAVVSVGTGILGRFRKSEESV